MIDYEVSRPGGTCCVTGRSFVEGESFYSALFDTAEGFSRKDYAEDSWQGPPEGVLCYFKTRMPRKAEPKKTFVDDETLINFFQRLADVEDASKLRFRFVLSLILLRKRLLKYEKTIREGGAEYWEMRLMRDKSTHRVYNPVLSDSEIEDLTAQLGSILAGYVPEDDGPAADAADAQGAAGNEAEPAGGSPSGADEDTTLS